MLARTILCSCKSSFSPKGQITRSSLERLNFCNSHTYTNKMQAFKQRLKACKRLKIGLLGLFSCCFGMLSEKVLSSESSKVVRKIQFALFRKTGFPKTLRSFPFFFRFLLPAVYSKTLAFQHMIAWYSSTLSTPFIATSILAIITPPANRPHPRSAHPRTDMLPAGYGLGSSSDRRP